MNLTTQPASQVSKSAWIGVVASLGVGVAGAAAAYRYLREPAAKEPTGAQEECWDDEVATVAYPKDRPRIAGTAVGAAVVGAVGKDVADRDEEIQEKRAEQRTVTETERRCAPVSSR